MLSHCPVPHLWVLRRFIFTFTKFVRPFSIPYRRNTFFFPPFFHVKYADYHPFCLGWCLQAPTSDTVARFTCRWPAAGLAASQHQTFSGTNSCIYRLLLFCEKNFVREGCVLWRVFLWKKNLCEKDFFLGKTFSGCILLILCTETLCRFLTASLVASQ